MPNRSAGARSLLNEAGLEQLGPAFNCTWPVHLASDFSGLLQAIDEADRELRRAREYKAPVG